MKTRTRRCVICDRIYYGFGHVAAPVAEGRCCDLCHTKHVEPARIMRRRMLGLPPVENEGGG